MKKLNNKGNMLLAYGIEALVTFVVLMFLFTILDDMWSSHLAPAAKATAHNSTLVNDTVDGFTSSWRVAPWLIILGLGLGFVVVALMVGKDG